jgi:hypothetical protein
MSLTVYQILHVASVVLFVAFTFQAFAAPTPERRKTVMMLSGVLSLVALVAGFGTAAKLGYGMPVWMIIKLVCWLGISALAGAAFRSPGKAKSYALVAGLLVLAAVASVYLKPFQ